MSAAFGPPVGDEGLDVLADLAEFPGLGDPVGFDGAEFGAVRCQVCGTDVDVETGAPLGPVDETTIANVEAFVLGEGVDDFGLEGQPLLDEGLPPEAGPIF